MIVVIWTGSLPKAGTTKQRYYVNFEPNPDPCFIPNPKS